MTIANNLVAKLSVAFVTVAMFFTMVAPAQAQTAEELQQMINDLLAQIASLQGEVGGSSAAGVCPYTWTRTLNMGATGADVMKLQQFLNADADTRVAVTGAGSAGMETQYYGPATGAAVAKFQAKYRTDILSPLGLVNPTTFFGNSTMAKANALCASAPTTPTTPGTSTGELDGGEASLEDLQGSDGDDTNLEEGQEDAPVADFEFDVEDGDVEVNRIDVAFDGSTNTSGGEDEPWKVFETVSIWVDGEMIAEEDADAKSDWMDDSPEDDVHTMRFTGLDWVVREGETAEFTVAVTVANSVDEAGTDADWEVFIPRDGIRAVDGLGIQNYLGEESNTSPTEAVDFDIDEEGGEDELVVKTSSNDPKATTLSLEDDEKSDWINVFTFDLDTDDSLSDITVNEIPVTIVLDGDTFGAVVNDLRLMIDGEEYDDWSIATGTTASSTVVVEFDTDGDLVIDAGDRVAAELEVEFKALATPGTTIQGLVTGSNAGDIDAEGADDLEGSQLDGQATGDEHTLRVSGVIIEFVDSTETFKENSDATTTDNEGEFTIEFDVTAFDSDLWIEKNAASGTASVTEGVNYQIQDGSGTVVAAAAITAVDEVLTSTADTDNGEFVVREGETETFTLTVIIDPAAGGFYQVQLYGVNFDLDTTGGGEVQQRALPATDFETDALNI